LKHLAAENSPRSPNYPILNTTLSASEQKPPYIFAYDTNNKENSTTTQTTLIVNLKMDRPLHPLGTQEVLLHASYPPTHPDRLCDWTVTSVTGELPPDTLAYSEWFASLPSRIETVSILNTLAFEYLAIALIVVWAMGLS
jgi:hypothetical protein